MGKNEIDEISGTETTGHEWDGIKELNTPLPRWWLWIFYACIAWAIIYMIAMPMPFSKGLLNYASRAEIVTELEKAKQAQSVFIAKIDGTEVADIVKDDELARFARAGGSSAFKVNCVQCHGAGASGSLGYPNLNDDEWVWGGSIDAIYTTIAHGARDDADEDTLISEMSAFGADELLEREEITAVANYVVSISGGETTPELIANGAEVFTDNCAACHGENAEGVAELGGPNLNNAIWLMVDGSIESITAQIDKPKHGVMPAWSGTLSDATIKQLAVYVHSLGGGE